MTLTLRTRTATGATTKGERLTSSELDGNFLHVLDSGNGTFVQYGSGAIAESVQAALRRRVFASQYSTVAEAITAAGDYGDIIFSPNTTYTIPASLTQRTGQRWIGLGGIRSATLTKGFNGTLITMGDLGELCNLNLNGNGGTYTGGNVVISSGFSQKIARVRSVSSVGSGIAVTGGFGGGLQISEVEVDTTSPTTVAAIDLTGATASNPKFLSKVWASGGFIDISGANDVFIDGCYSHHILTSSTTANYYISNTRYALSGDPLTIRGAGGQHSNCAFAGAITLANTSGLVFDPSCEFGSTITETAASCLFNSFFTQSTDFTTTWTAASVNPAIGDGSITGRYIRQGRVCRVQIKITMGGTTTFGTGLYSFSLPFNSHNGFTQEIPVVAECYDSSVTTSFPARAQISANSATFILGWNGSGVAPTVPFTWASGDILYVNFEYQTL